MKKETRKRVAAVLNAQCSQNLERIDGHAIHNLFAW